MKDKGITEVHAGTHSVSLMVRAKSEKIQWIGVLQGKHRDLVKKARQKNLEVRELSDEVLSATTGHVQHQGICAMVNVLPPEKSLFDLIESRGRDAWILVLDGVQDPHNLGACCRTACAMGVDAIVIPERRACGITATVSKVACGALSFLPIYTVTNLAQTLKKMQKIGVWCVATSEHASQVIDAVDLSGPLAIVCGNEQHGIRHLTGEQCDQLVSMPMSGPIKSLNVSVAVAMVLYACARDRTYLSLPKDK